MADRDRQIQRDRKTDRQTDRHTYRQTDMSTLNGPNMIYNRPKIVPKSTNI